MGLVGGALGSFATIKRERGVLKDASIEWLLGGRGCIDKKFRKNISPKSKFEVCKL